MPQIDFAPENKISKNVEYDRLKLKKDEKARILFVERPTYAWVHTLRAPKIIDGEAVKVWKDGRKGDKYLDYDLDFISRPLCLGDYGTLADKGVDAEHCPACKAASENDQVPAPERRFAANVIRYATARDGRLLKPFQCSCVVWSFTENIYAKLVDIAAEQGDIIGKDLVIGPCISENFQKYENYLPSDKTAANIDQATRALVDEVYQLNRIEDLEVACGRRVERKWMDNDLKQVADRWAVAKGTTAAPSIADTPDPRTLSDEMNALLATTPTDDPWAGMDATPAASAAEAGPSIPTSDSLVTTQPARADETPAQPPAALDFQALLNNLK